MVERRIDSLELSRPVSLCTPDGRLDRAAIGWSRRPLQRCNLSGRRLRKKRWEFWGLVSRDAILQFTVADIDYAKFAAVTFIELAGGRRVEHGAFARGLALGDTVEDGAIEVPALGLAIAREHSGTRLDAKFSALGGARLDAEIFVEPAHESLNVVVPWSDALFQFTSKHIGRRARGRVTVDGKMFSFDDALAALDFGRGVWPYRAHWRWAVAQLPGGGFNLGAEWTRGTGATENGLFLDGTLHKISGERALTDLAAHGPGCDLRFTPKISRRVQLPLGLLSARLDWACGTWSGTLTADDGATLTLDGAPGWNEELRARW